LLRFPPAKQWKIYRSPKELSTAWQTSSSTPWRGFAGITREGGNKPPSSQVFLFFVDHE